MSLHSSTCKHAFPFRPPTAFDRADLQYLRDFNNALRYQVGSQARSFAPTEVQQSGSHLACTSTARVQISIDLTYDTPWCLRLVS